jgi:hypothetical protein
MLAFRTRFLDYMWAGLPVLCSSGDALGDLAAARSFGIAVPPQDVQALTDAMMSVAGDRSQLERMASAARETAKEYTWDRTLAPLVDFVRDPVTALDRPRDASVNRRPGFGSIRWRLSRLREFHQDHGTRRTVDLLRRKLFGD